MLENLTYSCKIKIKIHLPATTTFMTKMKVYIKSKKLLAFSLFSWKRGFRWKIICSNIKSY